MPQFLKSFASEGPFSITFLLGLAVTVVVLFLAVAHWAPAQALRPDPVAAALGLHGDLTLTDAEGAAVGSLTVAGSLTPPVTAAAAPDLPESGLVLPGPDGAPRLELPGATVRYDDAYGGGDGFFDTTETAPAGLHYAIVQLTVRNRTHGPLAGRQGGSFFASDDEPRLFGIDSAGGLAAPAGNPPGLPCADLNPGAAGTCELAFLLPATRTLEGLQILWPTGFHLPLPAPAAE